MAKNGYPVLNHLICPRFKGTQMMLQEGRDSFQAVYDVTIGYKPIAKHIFWRFPAEVHVHIERLPIDSVPIGDGSDGGESVKEWLLQRWVKKDALLERFRTEGRFGEERRLLRGSLFRSVVSLILCLGGEAVICWGWARLIRRCASLPVVCSLGRVVVTVVGALWGRLVFLYRGRLH